MLTLLPKAKTAPVKTIPAHFAAVCEATKKDIAHIWG